MERYIEGKRGIERWMKRQLESKTWKGGERDEEEDKEDEER